MKAQQPRTRGAYFVQSITLAGRQSRHGFHQPTAENEYLTP
ncbi:hypothetical protein AXX16_4318 [Serratia rubidaea]|nr:hypothetical protein AXX16_4318 [Serratia rubidaea]